jgi:hypothetical protein
MSKENYPQITQIVCSKSVSFVLIRHLFRNESTSWCQQLITTTLHKIWRKIAIHCYSKGLLSTMRAMRIQYIMALSLE